MSSLRVQGCEDRLTGSIQEDEPLVPGEGRGARLLQAMDHAVAFAAIQELKLPHLCVSSALLRVSTAICIDSITSDAVKRKE